jgi:hypothetical protein
MIDLDRTDFETAVTQAAQWLAYPPTPDLAGRVSLRIVQGQAAQQPPLRLGWAVAIAALAVVALLLAAPPVRAALAEFLQIGVIRIFTGPPATLEATPAATAEAPVTATPAGQGGAPAAAPTRAPATPAPPPTAAAPLSLDALAGETTLEEAQRAAPFPVRLPAALGTPDRVFAQTVGSGRVVTLAWLDDAGAPRAVLQELGPGALVWKENPATVQETTIAGQPALWLDGPYVVILENGDADIRHLVMGRALLWEEGGVTYRLESELALEEAVAIAESLSEP